MKTFQPLRPTTRAAAPNNRVVLDINNILSFRKTYRTQPSSNLSLEFRNYFDAPLLPWETSLNPLLFWTNNFNSEPELPKLVLKYTGCCKSEINFIFSVFLTYILDEFENSPKLHKHFFIRPAGINVYLFNKQTLMPAYIF